MNFLTASLDRIVSGENENVVTINHPKGQFGTFDGYKKGDDGVLRLACSNWMSGQEREVAVLATISVELQENEAVNPGIIPNQENPSDYHDHKFRGTLGEKIKRPDELIRNIKLFGDTHKEHSGIPLNIRSLDENDIRPINIDGEHILIDMSVANNSDYLKETGKDIEIQATRFDLLGII